MVEDRVILRYFDGRAETSPDPVVTEARVTISVDGLETAALMALPLELEELALGFLFAECVIGDPSQVIEVRSNLRLHHVLVRLAPGAQAPMPEAVRTYTSGCGRSMSRISPLWEDRFPSVNGGSTHPVSDVLDAVNTLTRESALFRQTGGVHTAGLWRGGRFTWICDDIGRHNAVDKVIGHALREGWPPGEDSALVATGRLSSDIVLKVIRAGIPVLVSRSAPTSAAVQVAETHGVTMIGFARSSRCNIYTHPHRVQLH